MKKFSFAVVKISIISPLVLIAASLLLPDFSAYAQSNPATANNNALVDTMCNALELVTGNAGKAFAAFAIISLGIGFFTGKVSWGLMIGVAMGIAAMFGAPTIVSVLSGKDEYSCN